MNRELGLTTRLSPKLTLLPNVRAGNVYYCKRSVGVGPRPIVQNTPRKFDHVIIAIMCMNARRRDDVRFNASLFELSHVIFVRFFAAHCDNAARRLCDVQQIRTSIRH